MMSATCSESVCRTETLDADASNASSKARLARMIALAATGRGSLDVRGLPTAAARWVELCV